MFAVGWCACLQSGGVQVCSQQLQHHDTACVDVCVVYNRSKQIEKKCLIKSSEDPASHA